jgi:uncharacterized membrane protein
VEAHEPPAGGRSTRRYQRGTDEFTRVLAFSDAVFAIAMTLLVVGIEVPELSETDSVDELAGALNDDLPSFISFVISFLVIGRYWVAHHSFINRLAAIDARLIGINLIYLLFIAFLPFPTVLLGTYFENPLSVAVYAITVAIVSGMEVVLFSHAAHKGLMDEPMPDAVYRWGTTLSLSPVIFFLASIPVAFLDTGLAVAVWFLGIPFQIVADRFKPERADEFF